MKLDAESKKTLLSVGDAMVVVVSLYGSLRTSELFRLMDEADVGVNFEIFNLVLCAVIKAGKLREDDGVLTRDHREKMVFFTNQEEDEE